MFKLIRFRIFVIFALALLCSAKTFAQETRDAKPSEPSFEVLLQVLVASNAGEASQMPSALGNVVKKLKATFPFTDYRLTATYLNRVESGGTIESKGVIQETSASTTPTFQDWLLNSVKRATDSNGQNIIQASHFRFGTRFPIQMGQNVSYENTGLTITRLNLAENTPTVIGTLSASKTSELIVLVLTVRPAN